MYVFLGVASALMLIFILNFQVILSKLNDDPGNYLVQIICMLIPLSVTFYFFYISLMQRETDEKDRRKNNDKEQLIYNEILERLEKQNIQQEKIAEYMEKTAIELRRTRRPEGIVFIYKNYRLLKEYVNLSDGVQNTLNIVARITALEKQNIQQEKIAEYMEKTAIELRRTRRPEGIVFIYKNYRLLKEYVNLRDSVQNTLNIVARITTLENIYKELE